MEKISGFILSLVSAAAATALIEGFIPDGGMKKYVRYLVSLTVLLVLLSPLRSLLGAIPSLTANVGVDYDSVEALAKANSIVAMHIEDSLCEKFSINERDIDVSYDGQRIIVSAKRRLGLIESDFVSYIASTYGVEVQVSFYE